MAGDSTSNTLRAMKDLLIPINTTWEKYQDNHWIPVKLRDVKRNDIIRTSEGKRYRVQSDAEYWSMDDHWGVMADPLE